MKILLMGVLVSNLAWGHVLSDRECPQFSLDVMAVAQIKERGVPWEVMKKELPGVLKELVLSGHTYIRDKQDVLDFISWAAAVYHDEGTPEEWKNGAYKYCMDGHSIEA